MINTKFVCIIHLRSFQVFSDKCLSFRLEFVDEFPEIDIDQFQSETKTFIRKLEWILNKLYRQFFFY